MAEYVTTEEVRNHLMVDTTAHDAWINMMIPAISGAVESWLKDSWRAYVLAVDSNGEVIRDSSGDGLPIEDSNGRVVHPTVKAATLVEMAVQFRFRDGDGTPAVPSHWGHGYVLSAGPTSLLVAFRKTTLS